MRVLTKTLVLGALLVAAPAIADDDTLEAAIGGGLGGAAGAAIGNEIGGDEGAIIGGALGAAGGAYLATEEDGYDDDDRDDRFNEDFCPPGQAKKGRC